MVIVILLAGSKNIGNSFAFNRGGWVMGRQNSTLRIMTWNAEGFISIAKQHPLVKIRNQMMGAIQQYNPDILCLQEYRDIQNSHWAVSVRHELDSLGYIYAYVSNDSVLVRNDAWHNDVLHTGVAIFARRPFIDSARINIRNGAHNENAVYADINFNNKRVRLFTAHLSSFYIYADTAKSKADSNNNNIYSITYHRKATAQNKIRENEVLHEHEASILRSVIDSTPYPVVYCGDINSTPASYTYNKLRGNLQDAFLQKGSGIGATFYKLLQTLRIDVCLADKRFSIQQCTVPQLYLSDHFPVVTDVKWK